MAFYFKRRARMYQSDLSYRPNFFDLLDYVTRRSEKLGFQKKKKKEGF